MVNTLFSQRWNTEYENGRYANESSINFVSKIKAMLAKRQNISRVGLYIGCGNGRNYIPLVKCDLNILGIDISPVAIKQLSEKIPHLSEKLQCVDFVNYTSKELFDYIISIQVFQHGSKRQIKKYFEKSSQLLKPGGLLFLCVNSVSTEIYFNHVITETSNCGSLTICYTKGPKKDLDIHFYSRQELDELCKDFEYVVMPYENTTKRVLPKTGTWSQWELILQKK